MIRIALQLLVLAAVAVVGAVAVRAWHPEAPPLYFYPEQVKDGEVTLADAVRWAEAGEVLWVDARSREKFEAGHIEGAVLLNEQDDFDLLLFDAIDVLQNNADKRLVVYCGSELCSSSQKIAEKLEALGLFGDVHVLHGGEKALREAGLLK